MREINNNTERENKNKQKKSLVTLVRNYANNCRYSFNRMLQA